MIALRREATEVVHEDYMDGKNSGYLHKKLIHLGTS